MSRLLGTAALSGAVAANQAACSNGGKQSSGRTDSGGYAVVDPAPSPAPCARMAKLFRATARFEVSDGGPAEMVILVEEPTSPTVRLDFEKTGGKRTASGLELRDKVDAAKGSSLRSLFIQCDEGAGWVEINSSWDGKKSLDGQTPTLEFREGMVGFH